MLSANPRARTGNPRVKTRVPPAGSDPFTRTLPYTLAATLAAIAVAGGVYGFDRPADDGRPLAPANAAEPATVLWEAHHR